MPKREKKPAPQRQPAAEDGPKRPSAWRAFLTGQISIGPWSLSRGEGIFWVCLLVLTGILFLGHLGNQYLWQDEAQTALISRSVLIYGVPKGTDGTNFFSQEGGAEYGEHHLWRWHTWLPFYVLAGFFAVFGESTFVARLPFALFGMGTVFLTYGLVKLLWRNWRLAALAAGLLAVWVPFLLLARQCRWYTLASFFAVASLYSYVKFLEGRRWASLWLVLAASGLFHTHYVYCGALLPALLLHSLIFPRRKTLRLLVLAMITCVVNLPMMVWLTQMNYGQTYRLFDIHKFYFLVQFYLVLAAEYGFSPWLLGVVPLFILSRLVRTGSLRPAWRTYGSGATLLVLFVMLTILVLSPTAPYAYIRYLSAALPALVVLSALLLAAAREVHALLPAGLMALFLLFGGGNFLRPFLESKNIHPPAVKKPVRGMDMYKGFFYELTHDFDGPNEGMATYLNEHSRPDDGVLITYGDMPLKFYTRLRVMGGLTGEDLSAAGRPDWIIRRKHPMALRYTRPVFEKIDRLLSVPGDYQPIRLNYPDTAFENREHLHEHYFQTVKNEDPIILWKKTR